MKKIYGVAFTVLLVLTGCNEGNFIGQMDTPLEYSGYSNVLINDKDFEQLKSFLYEAEMMMHKPILEAKMNDEGVKVFREPIKSKSDLFRYYQTYLSNELAETMARKISDLSISKEYEYLALSNDDIDWFSIFDANPNSIKVVQHTTVQSVIEMELQTDPNTRIQYTIMRDKLGENPKIVQKTVQYN